MNAWPMIAACKAAQWRGLDYVERDLVGIAWDFGSSPNEAHGPGTPIWIVEFEERTLTLMSVKPG